MTFKAYIDNIRKKTGKSPEDFRAIAKRQGLLVPGLTATQLTTWLKREFGLGHGHAMAIWAVFKSKRWAGAPNSAKKPQT